MTRKLYDEDPRLLTFTGTVLSCTYAEKKKAYLVELDRTAFFPEEGGQMPDRGTLGGQTVVHVSLKKGMNGETYEETILHHVKEPMEVGTVVEGQIDWKNRFDQMQQHSGEHIISGLVHSHYGYDNVGFHLGADEVTLDFNGMLTLQQLREIELEANGAVKANFAVQVEFPSKEELEALDYRSKIELKGPVRIVTFPGYDVCACCAPHVAYTGEIGLIKITGVQAHRGGVRVNILCGDRAIADYTEKQDSVYAISVALSAKQNKVVSAVERLQQEARKMREQLNRLQAEVAEGKLKELPDPDVTDHALLVLEGLDPIAARNAANSMAERYKGYSAVLLGSEGEYRYMITSRNLDCKALAGKLRQTYGAKGGGSKEMIQGTIQITAPDELLTWLKLSDR